LIKKKGLDFKSRLAEIRISFKLRVTDRLFERYWRAKLKRRDFSIICNNCVAWGIYRKLGLPYSTPTVGLFFYSEDYIKFLENFEHYIRQPLKFKETSKHPEANALRKATSYPIGVLGDDVEIQFLHYQSEKEAADKWKRRTQRINFDNLFFIYSDAEEDFKEEFLLRYEKLPFKHKIFLSSKPQADMNSVVFIRDYQKEKRVGESSRNRKYEKYIDVIRWLNLEKNFSKS
jgi:uncharacterized protein (DUF1919 family)